MRLYKNFYIPSQIREELEDKTETKFRYRYLYIIHKLFHSKVNYRDYYKEHGVVLNNRLLSKILGINTGDTSYLIKKLIEWAYIIRVGAYQINKQSYSYKIAPFYEDMNICILKVEYSDAKFIKKLITTEEASFGNKTLYRNIKSIYNNKISINIDGINYLKSKYPSLNQIINKYPDNIEDELYTNIEQTDIILFSFLLKDYFINRPDFKNRIYTNISCLKKEYRKFILLDSLPIQIIDITNSQVLFGLMVIEQYLFKTKNKLPSDYLQFKNCVIGGNIYEELSGINNLIGSERKEFKKRFFKEVWYSKVVKKNKTELVKKFENKYPSVFESLQSIKHNDYTQFPIKLQEMEASIIIDYVLKKLYKLNITCLSIHDSIVINSDSSKQTATELISSIFQRKFKFLPKFNSE